MTVEELISILQNKPGNLQVVYSCCSEWCQLEEKDIGIQFLCLPRGDGWVHDARPDRPTQPYLTLPGN